MNNVILSSILGVFLIALSNFIPTKSILKNKYRKIDKRKLLEINIHVKNQLKLFLLLAFLLPLPMSFILSKIANSAINEIFMASVVFIISACIAMFGRYRRIAEITDVELSLRKK